MKHPIPSKHSWPRWLALAVLASSLWAQTSTSQLTGTVTDPSGAAVSGALVTTTNRETGVNHKQLTGGAGVYVFSAIPSGDYSITVEAPGFKAGRIDGIRVVINTPATINVTLQIGETADSVTVQAEGAAVNTSNATVGDVVSQQAVEKLPLNGRNPINLVMIQPGVVQTAAGGININGSRAFATNVTIDGIDANESSNPSVTNNIYRVSPDNVQEFKVTTNNPTAQEGRNSGGNVAIATRSGTNEFHGNLFEFFRNTALNAADFYSNANKLDKQTIKLNQYGFQIGGPIVRNKTFFFGSFEGQQINVALPITQSYGNVAVYSPSARAGIFRYFRADPSNPLTIGSTKITANSPLLVNSSTGALNSSVRACASNTDANCVASYDIVANDPQRTGLDSQISKLFAGYPAPNSYTSGDGLNVGSYLWNSPYRIRGPHYMGRIDHIFDEKNTLFGRYLYGQQTTFNGDPLNGYPQILPNTPPLGEVFRPSHNLALSYRHTFSPSVVNEATIGFSRFVFLFTQGEANPAFPDIPAYSFNLVSKAFSNLPRTQRSVTTPQFIDNLSFIRGKHILSVGTNIRFYEHNDLRGAQGSISISPSISLSATTRPPSGFATPSLAGTSGAGISSVDNANLLSAINDLLGIPASVTQRFQGDLNANTFAPYSTNGKVNLFARGNRVKQYNFYGQDEWKLRPNLTVNAGLRWESNRAPTEAGGRVYVPNRSMDGSQGLVTFGKADSWYNNDYSGGFAPRIAISWSPGTSGRTAIRAGYGISYDTISTLVTTSVASTIPGNGVTCTSVVGGSTTGGCTAVPDLRIGQGFPNELSVPSLQPSSYLTPAVQLRSSAPSIATYDQNLKLPTVHEWNLTLEHQFHGELLVSAGYVGHRGTRLFRSYDLNQVNSDPILPSFLIMQQNIANKCKADGTGCTGSAGGTAVPLVTQGTLTSSFVNSATTATDVAQNAAGNFAARVENTTLALHLRPNQQFSTINYLDSGADSYYHSLQTSVRKRYATGVLIGATYTFAKSIDNASSDPSGAGGSVSTTSTSIPADIRNFRNSRGRSDFDRTHAATINAIYDLPFGKGKRFLHDSGLTNRVVGGWSLNTLVTLQSGEPFSVLSGALTANASHQSYAALSSSTLPQPKLQQQAGVVGPVLYTSTTGFTLPGAGQNGIGRNVFTGPAYGNADISVSKAFDVTERLHAVLRAEAFNALNHINFRPGTLNILSSTFGQGLSAIGSAATRNTIQTGEPSRVIQLALKVYF